ncbi:MAG: FIST N-terminal domain-containing protein [Candidatus Omnitrophica bacterium]|nr:FIST N-terminal domain-containing protein [Candidatus Omnitrophota bacterium]MDD5430604.1 FIST N-terminal domain-containing protein [Candidatus Omnitrophota bacterium]
MEKDDFAIAFSKRKSEEAAKEVSLKIKSSFSKSIGFLFVFFTPHYNPSNILATLNLTLKPEKILGIQSPFLVFEDTLAQEGIVVCCMSGQDVSFEESFMEEKPSKEIESFLRLAFRKIRKKNFSLLSFLGPGINPVPYLSGLRLFLGEIFTLAGGGFTKKYSSNTWQIVNNDIIEGAVNIIVKGLDTTSLSLGGYLPLGKPFVITKAAPARNLVIEINNEPAINIYRKYLEEKFEQFQDNKLFSLYPLGIKNGEKFDVIRVLDSLADGSLACVGNLKEKDTGHIMFLDTGLLQNQIESQLSPLVAKNQGLVIIVGSLLQKEIIKDNSYTVVKLIKKSLGKNFSVIGMYCDYSMRSSRETNSIGIDSGNTLLTFWQ